MNIHWPFEKEHLIIADQNLNSQLSLVNMRFTIVESSVTLLMISGVRHP